MDRAGSWICDYRFARCQRRAGMGRMDLPDFNLTEEHSIGAERIADTIAQNFAPLEALALTIMVLRILARRASVPMSSLLGAMGKAEDAATGQEN